MNKSLKRTIEEWKSYSSKSRAVATGILASEQAILARKESNKGQEPSEKYGAIACARQILWILSKEEIDYEEDC